MPSDITRCDSNPSFCDIIPRVSSLHFHHRLAARIKQGKNKRKGEKRWSLIYLHKNKTKRRNFSCIVDQIKAEY